VGTEVCRNIDPDFWIKIFEKNIVNFQPTSVKALVIPDVRFKNEVDYIRSKNGVLIKVKRDLIPGVSPYQHQSEKGLDDELFDYVVENNGTVDELYKKIYDILNTLEERL
jgi:hypothetical protein